MDSDDRDGDPPRVLVVDAEHIRRTPMAPGRKLEAVIIDDPVREVGRMMRDGFTLDELRAVDAALPTLKEIDVTVEIDPAWLGEPFIPIRHYCSGDCDELCDRIRRHLHREPRSIRAEAQRNRRRRQALERMDRRAARRARKVAGINHLLHQLAEHDAREPSPAPDWQARVLDAIAKETP